MTNVQSWEQQDGEGAGAFAAFKTYRDMGPTRSLTKVSGVVGKSTAQMSKWSRRWRWVQRAEAWDREDDRLFTLEQREAKKAMARRHVRIASAFQSKVVQKLARLDPDEMTPTELMRMFEIAAKVEANAVGQIQEHVVTLQGDPNAFVASLTDEERRARIIALQREAAARQAEWGDIDQAADAARAAGAPDGDLVDAG